jgi:inner membrane protein
MYRTGHYGAALLAYAPVGGAALATGFDVAAVAGGALTLALAPLPDYDQRVPAISHRGVTHTVGFALLVGLLTGALGFVVGSETGLAGATAAGAFGLVVGALAIGSHLLADVVTPMGISPFWPLSSRNYTLSLARADDTVANYLLLLAGITATVATALVAGG